MGIKSKVAFTEEKGRIRLESVVSMEEAFGIDGDVMYEIVKKIGLEEK